MRWWLPLKERKKNKALRTALETVVEVASKNSGRGFDASSTILNIGLFLLLAERDIQSVKIDALTHPDEWHRKLCARVIVLTIHEWDFDKVTGTSLKNALNAAGVSEQSRQEAVAALRIVRNVQRKVRKTFGSLRNSTIAHRDADALAQYRAIRDINIDEVFTVAGEFYSGAERFINVLPKLLAESSTLHSLLSQWLQSEQAQK